MTHDFPFPYHVVTITTNLFFSPRVSDSAIPLSSPVPSIPTVPPFKVYVIFWLSILTFLPLLFLPQSYLSRPQLLQMQIVGYFSPLVILQNSHFIVESRRLYHEVILNYLVHIHIRVQVLLCKSSYWFLQPIPTFTFLTDKFSRLLFVSLF